MSTLPQLLEEDVQQLDSVLHRLLANSEARIAAVIDKGGFLIAHHGSPDGIDLTSVAALASGAHMASEVIAKLLREEKFDCTFQQGEKSGILVMNVDEACLIAVIFPADISVGAVKYFTALSSAEIARQLQIARERSPGAGLDLSVMNLADPAPLFRKKSQ
jgi:predicted regulator of Ras-like GTPase activity (Roadblock/LC7/MglB family)